MNIIPESISGKVTLWKGCPDNNPLKKQLEEEFRRFSEQENDLSREELFKKSYMDDHRLIVSFLPNSASYNKYGETATLVSIQMSEEEKIGFVQRVNNNTCSIGRLDSSNG